MGNGVGGGAAGIYEAIGAKTVAPKLNILAIEKGKPLSKVDPMLVTRWGLNGQVILRLSAWGARDLFSSGYKGILIVDFVPDLHIEDMKSILSKHKKQFVIILWFMWRYLVGFHFKQLLISIAHLLKHCTFEVTGKGQFKDEFVTAGSVPLSEVLSFILLFSVSLSLPRV
ncbi:hypothetical protein Patl1_22096 [Pistacia atlantica]|uniref:Uncharacterized protein n=1 Tax=Pistacia atlantica TaxID=434234 RepID=A0ACC1BNN3_9ROSI|nr:hypothetical protein Patl1_22096 [Pistacia atlantica]